MPRAASKSSLRSFLGRFRQAKPALLLLLIILGAAFGVTLIVSPSVRLMTTGHHSATDAARLTRQVAEQKRKNQQLEEQISQLKSPEGIAEISRKKGMVKPGEHAVQLEILPPKSTTAPAHTAKPVRKGAERLLLRLGILFLAAFLGGLIWRLVSRRRHPRIHSDGTLTPRSELRRRKSIEPMQ